MKKLCVICLILMLCLCGCQSNMQNEVDNSSTPSETTQDSNNFEETITEKLVREIEGAYLEEQELPENSTTIGMVELADKYTEKWKQVADEYYNKIMQYDGIVQPSEYYYSSDDLHTFVSNMKTNWEQYNQVQCENYVKSLQAIYNGGTIVGPIFAQYKYEMQKEWALQIVGICQQLHIE